MSNDLAEQYPEALRFEELTRDRDQFRSFLVLHDHEERAEEDPAHRFVIMGDLMPLCGIEDAFAPVEGYDGMFGHYVIEMVLANFYDNPKVLIDSEGMTFFAYAKTRDDAESFIDDIVALAHKFPIIVQTV